MSTRPGSGDDRREREFRPDEEEDEFEPIGDYAAIGNSHSVALVSRSGSLDWWCPLRFDHPPVFAALLDRERGGHFAVRPEGEFSVERRYRQETNVLETEFRTGTGRFRLVDLIPLASDDPGREELEMHHGILREVECLEGRVDLRVSYRPRWEYGCRAADLEERGSTGIYSEEEDEALLFRTDLPVEIGEDGEAARGRVELMEDDRAHLAVTFARREPLLVPALGHGARKVIDRASDWWRDWSRETDYEGPYRDAVLRSGLALKLLTYAPSGAIVAAPTTSLPEEIGGEQNWDYRYCWLRDATMTAVALLELGEPEHADSFLNWLLHATGRSQPELRVLYDVFGHPPPRERTLEHLGGYRGSTPVRVGNGAVDQRQLDVYGEVIGAARAMAERGGELGRARSRALRGFGDVVCESWTEPDRGIWEVRSGRHHHTLSKAQCWLALDDLLALHRNGRIEVPADRYRQEKNAIGETIESRGWNEEAGSYVSRFGGTEVDASLLLLALRGYVEPDSDRMLSTWQRIRSELEVDGLYRRYGASYDDGLSGEEAAFGICSFWAAEYLASTGDVQAAREQFERTLRCANDVGLFSEEVDPESGTLLGNFPQAFTHLGLIGAALCIGRVEEGGYEAAGTHRRPGQRGREGADDGLDGRGEP